VNAAEGQGFTIQHATGWYLNFGIAGLIAGALFVGWLWSFLFNRLDASRPSRTQFGRVVSVVAFWTFTGYLPTLLRAPIEGYKAVVIEGILVPAIVVLFASVHVVLREGRPALVPLKTRYSGASAVPKFAI
jgi:hypothetical protein